MLLALFADVHANRQAFDACLEAARARGAKRFILLGDFVGYGADPEWSVDTVMRLVEEGEDPAAIVSFEMEMMILPRLKGTHVPACLGTGDFTRQAYVVMECIPGETLYRRLPALPLA